MDEEEMKKTPILMTDAMVAELLGVARSTFYRMLRSGNFDLSPVIVGKSRRWKKSEVMVWIEGGGNSSK